MSQPLSPLPEPHSNARRTGAVVSVFLLLVYGVIARLMFVTDWLKASGGVVGF
jgi:hypothetical protein